MFQLWTLNLNDSEFELDEVAKDVEGIWEDPVFVELSEFSADDGGTARVALWLLLAILLADGTWYCWLCKNV